MTHKHPLTDDLCYQIWQDNKDNWLMWQEPCPSTRRLIRAAVDWQLEQVLKWLNETIFERGSSFEAVNIPEELEEAMRPTTTQEDS